MFNLTFGDDVQCCGPVASLSVDVPPCHAEPGLMVLLPRCRPSQTNDSCSSIVKPVPPAHVATTDSVAQADVSADEMSSTVGSSHSGVSKISPPPSPSLVPNIGLNIPSISHLFASFASIGAIRFD